MRGTSQIWTQEPSICLWRSAVAACSWLSLFPVASVLTPEAFAILPYRYTQGAICWLLGIAAVVVSVNC